jgi:hypothetical protein
MTDNAYPTRRSFADHATPVAEPTPFAEPTPGWSNAPADSGITSREGPPTPIDPTSPGWSNNGPAATGATAGTPGSYTPAGSEAPNKFTSMNTVTASPATAWTIGQYVVVGDGTFAHWGGAAWTSGKA